MTNTDPHLITLSEIAARADVTPAAVSNWRRRHATFPTPVRDDLFDAASIDRWLSTRKTRTATPKSVQGSTGWELLSILRREVDVAAAMNVAASVVTLCHFDTTVDAADLSGSATRVESEYALPTGSLSSPLRNSGIMNQATLAAMVEMVRAYIATGGSAAELFNEIVSFDAGPRASEHTSTAIMIDFLSELAGTTAASVLDPACGTGALLTAAAQRVNPATIAGYELNETTWALCVQRLALQNLPTDAIRRGDFFAHPAQGVDLVVCAPPLGTRIDRESPAFSLLQTLGAGDSFKNAGDFAWLFAARNALAPSGTAVVVTPSSPTFAGGVSQRLRHELLRSGSVSAVIALPGGMVPGTSIPVVVWILTSRTSDAGRVLLINVDAAATRRPDPQLLTAAAREFHTWRDAPDTYEPVAALTAAVPVLELLAGDVALTPARWTEVPTDPHAAINDTREALDELTAAASATAQLHIPSIELTAGHDLDLHSLHDLAVQSHLVVERPRHINRDDVAETGEHPYVTGVTDEGPRIVGYLSDLPEHAVITQAGDVILSTLGQARAVVDRTGGHVLGSAVWLIRPTTDNPAVQPDLLALLLSSPRIGQQAVGTTVQRLRNPRDVRIPWLGRDTAPAAADMARTIAQVSRTAYELSAAANTAAATFAAALDAGVTATIQERS